MGIYYILLRRISSGANNCVQRVFDKNVFYNDISPHLKCLLSNERLDFCDKKKGQQCKFIFTAFFDHIYQGYRYFWP